MPGTVPSTSPVSTHLILVTTSEAGTVPVLQTGGLVGRSPVWVISDRLAPEPDLLPPRLEFQGEKFQYPVSNGGL